MKRTLFLLLAMSAVTASAWGLPETNPCAQGQAWDQTENTCVAEITGGNINPGVRTSNIFTLTAPGSTSPAPALPETEVRQQKSEGR